MLPFAIEIVPDGSIAEQIVLAVKRAVVRGQLRPGDRFPSVRNLSQELRINPTTAHRVITSLVEQGVLIATPTVGTVVAESSSGTPAEISGILGSDLEKLVVEAKRRGASFEQVHRALEKHWRELEQKQKRS
jgi:GntR family transcriptional regulator